MNLFHTILDSVFPPRPHQALVARTTPAQLAAHLCPRHISAQIVALLPYHVPLVRACIVEAKFYDNRRAQRLLGGTLAFFLRMQHTLLPGMPLKGAQAIPIPLSTARARERGYNQVARIMQHTVRQHAPCIPAPHLLMRTRATLPQTSLTQHARHENVAGAFAAPIPLDPAVCYIVVDDVVTTGATMQAAIAALRAAGAIHIYGIALATQTRRAAFDDMPPMTYSAEIRRRD